MSILNSRYQDTENKPNNKLRQKKNKTKTRQFQCILSVVTIHYILKEIKESSIGLFFVVSVNEYSYASEVILTKNTFKWIRLCNREYANKVPLELAHFQARHFFFNRRFIFKRIHSMFVFL